jgi:hypothetical protein
MQQNGEQQPIRPNRMFEGNKAHQAGSRQIKGKCQNVEPGGPNGYGWGKKSFTGGGFLIKVSFYE